MNTQTFEIITSDSLESNIQRLKEAYNSLPLPDIESPILRLKGNPRKGNIKADYELVSYPGHSYFHIETSKFATQLAVLFSEAAKELAKRGQ